MRHPLSFIRYNKEMLKLIFGFCRTILLHIIAAVFDTGTKAINRVEMNETRDSVLMDTSPRTWPTYVDPKPCTD